MFVTGIQSEGHPPDRVMVGSDRDEAVENAFKLAFRFGGVLFQEGSQFEKDLRFNRRALLPGHSSPTMVWIKESVSREEIA